MKSFLVLLILVVSQDIKGASTPYSGGASVYDRKAKLIAMHKHGAYYDYDLSEVVSNSYIDILDLSKPEVGIVRIENTPRFIALKWAGNGNFLLGVSNIPDATPNFVIYDNNGVKLTEHYIECTKSKYSPMFCGNNICTDQHWVSGQLKGMEFSFDGALATICIGRYCNTFTIQSKN